MSEISRRSAVSVGVGTLGLAALSIAAVPAPSAASNVPAARAASAASASAAGAEKLAIPVRSLYAGSVGQIFTAEAGGSRFELTLKAIEDVTPVTVADDEHRFNLLFESKRLGSADGIFTLRRAGVPTTALFVSPIGPRSSTHTLQAIVNRSA